MNTLKKLQEQARRLESEMDDIVENDGRISDWQAKRDELNIIKNIKIPAELNRQRPIQQGGYEAHIYSVPRHV